MRILLVSDTYLPLVSGNVIVVDQTARALAKRGHQVFLLVPGKHHQSRMVKQKNLTIFFTHAFKNPIRLNSYLPIISTSDWQFLKQANPDLIHVHTPGPVGLLARRFAINHQVPLVITVHGMPDFLLSYLKFKNPLLTQSLNHLGWTIWKMILKPADVVIVPAEHVANQLKTYQVKNKIKVLPFWIEIDRKLLNKRKKQKHRHCILTKSNKLTFLYYGRLDTDKNIELLMKAWSRSHLAVKKAQLILVGTSAELNQLKRLAKNLAIESSVRFLGMIPDASYRALGVKPEKTDCLMEEVYDQADFFVIASNIETQCITGYLATMFGLPIIGSSKGALPELIKKTPFPELVFQADNVKALTDSIDRVIANKKHYRKYRPLASVVSQYSKEAVLTKLENLYRFTIKLS